MKILAIENALISLCQDTLKDKVREVASLPGGWSLDMLNRSLQKAPCVYVAYQGSALGKDETSHNARFTVYTVSKGADEEQRRRGNPRIMGAYDMLSALVPKLNNQVVKDIGRLKMASIDNLFRDALFDIGGTVYGIQLTLNAAPFDEFDIGSLNDFLTVHAEHQVGGNDTPNAADIINVRG